MSDPVLLQAITTIGTLAVALVTAVVSIFNGRATRRNSELIHEQREQMVLLVKQTDGMQASLVKVTGEAEFAKGLKQGTECAEEKQ